MNKFQSSRARTRTTFNSAHNMQTLEYGDMLNNVVIESIHVLNNQHQYDEDDEVIQKSYWDEIWQKNDVRDVDEQEDLITIITSKIVSDDPTFKQTIHSFLLHWEDIFSRSLSEAPAIYHH